MDFNPLYVNQLCEYILEIIKNGKRINPQTLKLPSGKKLKGDELKIFMEEKNKIERRLDNLDVY